MEDSLRRLQTDVIDLYQAHRDDDSTPLVETLKAFDSLIKEGKVRAIGASNCAQRLQERWTSVSREDWRAMKPCSPVQPVRSPEYESGLEQVAVKNGLGVINYSLASGFLSGKYKSRKTPARAARAL